MSNSVSLIAKYLGASKQAELAVKLSKDLEGSSDNIQGLCDLLDGLDGQVSKEIYPNVLEYSFNILDHPEAHTEEAYSNVLKLVKKLPNLSDDLTSRIVNYLEIYLSSSSRNFIPKLKDILAEYDINYSTTYEEKLSNEFILTLFKFLEYLFMNHGDANGTDSIDSILLFFIGINDDQISTIISKLLRWRMNSIIRKTRDSKLVWNIIFTLEDSGNKIHKSHSFILWLRYLHLNNLSNNQIYQNTIKSSKYWKILQNGLISNSHEHRKFCLSILQLSVKFINTTFSNDIITWDNDKKGQYLKEWSRYITLFEILGIDTSLHQAEAGINDIIGLISPESLVHPSWGFCLLSTGFKATMDSVRKFSLNLLLSIPLKNLYLIKYSLNSFEEIYLPYAMSAPHFAVRLINDKNTCEYGNRLTEFISNILMNLNCDQEYKDVTYSILKVLNNLKESFDPARIYVSLGILKGLQNKQVLKFGLHDKLLFSLFESTSEGELFETTSQTINLRLLLNFKFSTITELIETLNRYAKFNGFKLIKDYKLLILNYLKSNGIDSDILFDSLNDEVSEDNKVLIVGLINNKDELVDYLVLQSDIFLTKLLKSELAVDLFNNSKAARLFQQLIRRALSNTESIEVYEVLSTVDFKRYKFLLPNTLNLHELWLDVIEEVQSNNFHVLSLMVNKFKLLNNLLKISDFKIDIEPIIGFNKIMLINSLEVSKSVNDFYKLKDEIFGEYFTLLSIFTKKVSIHDEANIKKILDIIDPNSSHYKLNLSLVHLINNLLSSKLSIQLIETIVEFLTDLWNNLNSSRLQLNQKDLHVLLINTLCNSIILTKSIDNVLISEKLLNFSESVIENAQGRRCLLPTLTKSLSNYQISQSDNFEKIEWVPEILVRSVIMFQLRNNIFKLENIIGQLYDKELSMESDSNIYHRIYGPEEASAKINLMAILNSIKGTEFAFKIFKFIIDYEHEFNLFKVVKTTDGFEEWRRIQLFTVIISIINTIGSSISLDDYLDLFINLLETEPSPLVRVYLEWIISIQMNDKVLGKLFNSLLHESSTLKPSVITSYERIIFLSIQQLPVEAETEFLSKFLTIIIPSATSNKATTRHFSLSLICSIYLEIESKKLQLDLKLVNIVENMYHTALSSESFGQYRSGDALLWNIKKDLTLVSISGGVLLRLSDREDFDYIKKEEYAKYLSKEQIAILNNPIGENLQELWVKERKQRQKKSVITSDNSSIQSPLQTKSGAWTSVMDIDQKSRGSEVLRSDLIVVSSLVDKPPNLGGICRLCDVLGAGLLTLNDIKVKSNPQFKNVAVTADYWMPMIEVKPEGIRDFLLEKKRQGYMLIGLEQTDKSIELNCEFKFPKKSLILLGAEKEGIRGDLLAELDCCLEIKQVGVIRSMNIQTATAIIVHAYSSQHC